MIMPFVLIGALELNLQVLKFAMSGNSTYRKRRRQDSVENFLGGKARRPYVLTQRHCHWFERK